MGSENKIKVVINGVVIPKLSDYSFFDAKSYFKEPQRSALGVINNLNSYATFLTPRLKFKFKYMPIETYRVIMKLIKDYNELIVTVYDIVEDKYATHKMYFSPKEFPQIFQKSLEVLAILDEEFEMVGTNTDVDEISIIYNNNTTPVTTTGYTTYYGLDFIVGSYDIDVDDAVDPKTYTRTNFNLDSWNTKADGTGTKYITGATITASTYMVLYAQWVATTNFVLSYNYDSATSGNTEINKEVVQGSAVGELPTPVKNGYMFGGWFTLQDGAGTQITSSSIYNYAQNITIYAKWTGTQNTITYNNNGGTGTMSSSNVASGSSFTLPKCTLTKQGYVFAGWTNLIDGTSVVYLDEAKITMPITDITLYAIYTLGYYLTYNTSGGSNDGYSEYGKTIKEAIYTEKSGYKLSGWYNDNAFTQPATFPLTLTANITIYAKWEANE
jgi:uncharacterized repeat protein (TIGR02543 family)